jgi:hypothetical protein
VALVLILHSEESKMTHSSGFLVGIDLSQVSDVGVWGHVQPRGSMSICDFGFTSESVVQKMTSA